MAVSTAESEPARADGSAGPGGHKVWLILAGIVVASIVVRVGIAASVPVRRLIDPDTPGYLRPAWALVDDGTFHVSPSVPVAEFFRTPGYPVFLAVVSQVVGRSVRNLAILQAALSAFTALGVYLLARRWWDSRAVAVGAAALAAFEPLQIWASGQILTESLTAALYIVLALVATAAARTRSPSRWALVGLVLAAATYVRPATYYVPIVLGPVMIVALVWIAPAEKHVWRRALVTTAALLLPFVLLVGLWQVRNHNEVGSWRFTAVEAYSIFDYRAPEVLAYDSGASFQKNRNLLDYLFATSHRGLSQGKYWDDMYKEGFKIVRQHPKAYAVTAGIGVFVVTLGLRPNLLDTLGIKQEGAVTWLAETGLLAFYVLTVVGVVRIFRDEGSRTVRPAHLLVLALVLYTIIAAGIAVGPRGTARLRAPVMPLLCPYAALGTATLIRRVQQRRALPV